MRRIWIFLVCLFIMGSSLHSQEVDSNGEIKKSKEIPNPVNLKPNWFTFYEVDDSLLNQRIEQTQQALSQLVQDVDEKQKEQVNRLIQQISSNLKTFKGLKEKQVKTPLIAWVSHSTYSLEQFIELADKTKAAKLIVRNEEISLERQQNHLYDLRQQIRNEYAQYLATAEPNEKSLIKGLNLIAQKTRLEYLEEELRMTKESLDIHKRLVRRYEDELNTALALLDIRAIQSEKFDQQISSLQQKMRSVQRRLYQAEAEMVNAFDDGTEARRAGYQLANQKMLHAQVDQAALEAGIYFREALKSLSTLSKDPEPGFIEELIQRWTQFYDKTLDQMKNWEALSATERDLSSKSLIRVNQSGEEKDPTVAELHRSRNEQSLETMISLENLSRQLYHLDLAIDIFQNKILDDQSYFEQIYYHFQTFWEGFQKFFSNWMYVTLFEMGGTPITVIGILKAILVICLSFWASRFVRSTLKRVGKKRKKMTDSTIYALGRIIHYMILTIGGLIAFTAMGLTVGNLAIILGALGIGIGFGLQSLVNNFLSGLTILFERKIKVGDFIEFETGQIGKVTEITVQNSTIHTFDGTDILVPNSTLVANKIVNWTKEDPYLRLHVPFSVAYGSDPDQVFQVITEAAKTVPCTLTGVPGVPEPELWLKKFGESSLDYELIVWVNVFKSGGRSSLIASYTHIIHRTLVENEISIPFPQRVLHLKSMSKEFSEQLHPVGKEE